MKADYIWNVLHRLEETRGHLSLRDLRSLPDAEVRALLESLPGVGMKTASLLMLFDLARPAIPVENHIGRVAARLDLVPARWSLLKIERWFDEVLPGEWSVRYAAHVATIRHGRQTCLARRPRCEACVLRDLCPSAGLFLSGERET